MFGNDSAVPMETQPSFNSAGSNTPPVESLSAFCQDLAPLPLISPLHSLKEAVSGPTKKPSSQNLSVELTMRNCPDGEAIPEDNGTTELGLSKVTSEGTHGAEDPSIDCGPSAAANGESAEEEMEDGEAMDTDPSHAGPAPCYMGPPPIEIAISFDTTGSMSQCIEQVQAQVGHMIERLFMDIPNLKIAVIAHGDYCDAEHFYVTQKVDFTNELPTLAKFVKEVTGTGGGDWEECYELVLNMARTELSWSPGTQRSMIMIGDAIPHPAGPTSRNLDWRQECDQLYNDLVSPRSVSLANSSFLFH